MGISLDEKFSNHSVTKMLVGVAAAQVVAKDHRSKGPGFQSHGDLRISLFSLKVAENLIDLYKRWANPGLIFHLFSSFCTNLVASRIRTRIVQVEGKDADHWTTTTALKI